MDLLDKMAAQIADSDRQFVGLLRRLGITRDDLKNIVKKIQTCSGLGRNALRYSSSPRRGGHV